MSRLLIALLGSLLLITCGGSELTQDEYAERTLAALAHTEELGRKTADCLGYDRNKAEVWLFEDPRYRAVAERLDHLDERMTVLRVEEGIVMPETFDLRTARLSAEDWEKMEPLAAESLAAFEEMLGVMVDIFENAGCDV